LCPLGLSKRNRDLFKKIQNYLKVKLSVDNLVRESDEFDLLKKYLFNESELYVFENIEKYKSRILSYEKKKRFEIEHFNKAYTDIQGNKKLNEILNQSV
jgi:hypothetical protein